MNVQSSKKDGPPEWPVTPYADYQRLLEDAEDQEDIRAIELHNPDEEGIPHEVFKRLLNENPVRVWREHRGLSLTGLAQLCNVIAPAISQIENGHRRPSVRLLQALAAALDVDMDDLAP
jgi:DNA-binding XRE family transcriptional regulator